MIADPADTGPSPKPAFSGTTANSTVSAPTSEASWRVIIEPLFMRPPVNQPIPGAKSTVLAAALADPEDGAEVQILRQADFDRLGVTWEAFAAKAQAQASAELARLTPEYLRDKHEVIECAILRSDRPTTTSVVLAPEFLKHFADTLGEKLLIAIPNRFTLYVFPALASRYSDYGARVLSDYNTSTYPVSREVFELSNQGLKAVGTFERQ